MAKNDDKSSTLSMAEKVVAAYERVCEAGHFGKVPARNLLVTSIKMLIDSLARSDRSLTRTAKTVNSFHAAAEEIKKVVSEQANDKGLWMNTITAPEAYLQQELRRLHAIIEQFFGET